MPNIIIKISKGEAKWFAECEWLDIYAVGDSASSAILEFGKLFAHFMQHYTTIDPANISSRAHQLKRRFEEFG